jgi:ABC-type glutathione transport system ATPase component
VLFLDEPTAGVDVHNRALFWELIREEAAAGVTVFVTTHFLEEVDYCDWRPSIDAGRLIANATPEDLRRQYSAGYRIRVDRPAPALEPEGAALRAAGFTWRAANGGTELRVDALDAPALALLQRAAAGRPSRSSNPRWPTCSAASLRTRCTHELAAPADAHPPGSARDAARPVYRHRADLRAARRRCSCSASPSPPR